MTPEEGSAENTSAQSGATTAARRPSGRGGRYSRGRRRPRRTSNQPRRLPVSSDVPPESDSAVDSAPEPARERVRETERPREPLPPPFQPAKVESIQGAIEKATAIIGDLRDVLNDMELVLEYLEDAERQQIADEREIENLQQRLNSMHRRPERPDRSDRYQTQQRPPQRPTEERTDPEDAD